MTGSFRTILLIQFRPIGDILLSTPMISVLRKACPDAHIVFLVEKVPGQMLENNPDLDEILYYPPKSKGLRQTIAFLRSLGKRDWDLSIDLYGTGGTAWATVFAGAKTRIGYTVRLRRHAYTVQVSNKVPDRYSALKKLALLKPLGIDDETPELTLKLHEGERAFAEKYFEDAGIDSSRLTVSLAPASKREVKAWFPEKWAELADILNAEYNANVLLLWGPGEEAVIDRVVSLMKTAAFTIPKTTLREMAAIIGKTHLCISGCTGNKHIAVAMGLPTVTIFGPTTPVTWSYPDPVRQRYVQGDLPCIPCNKRRCAHMSCMHGVLPEHIIAEMKKIPEIQRFLN